MPLGLFPDHLVNVHWEGGLAVEFGDRDEDARDPAKN